MATSSLFHHLLVRAFALSVSLLLVSVPSTFAATLGDMEIFSGPGENLRAEVPIFDVDPAIAQTLVASVADEALSKAADLIQSESLPFLSSELSQRDDGSWYLMLASSESMPNEYNEIILELTWQNGSYLREYVLSFEGATPPAQSTQDVIQTAPLVSVSQEEPSRFQVVKGDSLLSIARSLTGSDGSGIGDTNSRAAALLPGTAQIMFAIYNNNPAAFGGSPDELRAGTTLEIPALAEIAAIDTEQARALFSAEPSLTTTSTAITTSNTLSEVSPASTTTSENAAPEEIVGLQERDTSVPLYVTVSPVALEDDLARTQAIVAETQQALDPIKSDVRATDQRVAALNESVGSIRTQLVSVEDSVVALDSVVEETSERVGELGAQLVTLRAVNEDLKSTLASRSIDVAIKKTVSSATGSERTTSPFADSDYKRSILLLGLAIALAFGLVARQILARRKNLANTQPRDDAPVLAKENPISEKTTDTTMSMKSNDKMKEIAVFDQPNEVQQLEENSERLSAVAWFSEHLQSARISDEALVEALKGLPHRQDLRLRLMERYAKQKDVTRFSQLGQDMFRMTRGRNPEWPEVIQLALALELEMQVVKGKIESKVKPVRLAEHLDLTLDRTAV